MLKPKGMSDIRSVRSIESASVPRGRPGTLLQMHRLAEEKHRLEREVDMWTRKREQLERRLTEIEQQLGHLRKVTERVEERDGSKPSPPGWREVVLEY